MKEDPLRVNRLHSGKAGFDTRNGEELSNSQVAYLAWVLLSFSPFPVQNPVASHSWPFPFSTYTETRIKYGAGLFHHSSPRLSTLYNHRHS